MAENWKRIKRHTGYYVSNFGNIKRSPLVFITPHNSIVEAAQDNGVEPSNIVKCCKGKHNTCGGYLWAYSKMVADIKK